MTDKQQITLEEKIANAKAILDDLVEATQEPAVRAAICDGFWEDEDPEVFGETAELLAQNYAQNEPIRVRCSVSLPDFYISFDVNQETEEDVYKYENIGVQHDR